jgi:phospholipase D1/2
MGPRMNLVAAKVKDHGILAVTMLRLMPTAPFTLVNMIAGATKIRVVDYAVGTFLGLAPGILAMSALGGRIIEVLRNPTFIDVSIFVAIMVAWFGLSFVLQTAMTRFRKAQA